MLPSSQSSSSDLTIPFEFTTTTTTTTTTNTSGLFPLLEVDMKLVSDPIIDNKIIMQSSEIDAIIEDVCFQDGILIKLDNLIADKKLNKQQRRIEKKKNKLLMQFETKKHEAFNGNIVSKNRRDYDKNIDNVQQMPSEKSVLHFMRRCKVQVPRQLNSLDYFLFTGYISIEIVPKDAFYEPAKPYMHMTVVERRSDYFQIEPSQIEFSNNFEIAIKLLEAQRSLEEFMYSQKLRVYQRITEGNLLSLKRIKDIYRFDIPSLEELSWKRKQFRDAQLLTQINSMIQEDSFFFSCDMGLNLVDGVARPSSLTWGCNTLMLFGIEPKSADAFMQKNDSMRRVLPRETRQQISIATLDIRLNCEEDQAIQSVVIPSAKLNTIDEIDLFCDIKISLFAVKFPKELDLPEDIKLSPDVESFMIIEYVITSDILSYILSRRAPFVGSRTPSDLEIEALQPYDVEQSVLSQMFLERFYMKEIQEKFPHLYPETTLNENIKPRNQCGYRSIQ